MFDVFLRLGQSNTRQLDREECRVPPTADLLHVAWVWSSTEMDTVLSQTEREVFRRIGNVADYTAIVQVSSNLGENIRGLFSFKLATPLLLQLDVVLKELLWQH